MGYKNQFALVVMTNKDVYYVTRDDAQHMLGVIDNLDRPRGSYISIKDAKSGAKVLLSVANISSIVVERQDER